MVKIINPAEMARNFRSELKTEIQSLKNDLTIGGLLATDFAPSKTYANYTKQACEAVGINFKLLDVSRFNLESQIESLNKDKSISGIFIYYPIFGGGHDNYIKDLVDYKKDIEGLSSYWLKKLYTDQRHDTNGQKSISPCTPLSIIKLIASLPETVANKKIAIFNRSEVVGRPLASMLAHDGAEVYSFDISECLLYKDNNVSESNLSRQEVLKNADIIITGVPNNKFELISAVEIKEDVIGVNFSTYKNFSKEAIEKMHSFIPRIGPMTVTMAMRNVLRLYNNYHK